MVVFCNVSNLFLDFLGKTMFRKPVQILLEISPVEELADESEETPTAHTIGITLESGTFKPCSNVQLL